MPEIIKTAKIKNTISELKLIEREFRFLYNNKKKIKESYRDAFLDNYSSIISKLKNLENTDRNIRAHYTDKHLSIGVALITLADGANLPDTEKICSFINSFSEKQIILNEEFELIKWEFCSELIYEIYNIVVLDKNSEYELIQLIALLSKSENIKLSEIQKQCNPIEIVFSKDVTGTYQKSDDITKSKLRFYTAEIARKRKQNEEYTAEYFMKKTINAHRRNFSVQERQLSFYIENEYEKIFKNLPPKLYISLNFLIPLIFSFFSYSIIKNFWIIPILYLPLFEITKLVIDFIFSRNTGTAYLSRYQNYNKIADNAKTLAVISVVVPDTNSIKSITKKMERLYHLNKSPNLKYCILCDYVPASVPSPTKNKPIADAAKAMVRRLNSKYKDSFILALREQTFSKTENSYIGFDRKRGAIEQLVRIIKGEKIISVDVQGDTKFLKKVKYLIALDFDTVPLMDSFSSLVSIAEYPQNMPYISNGRVVSGYGIITPKITTKLDSSIKTPFAKLFGGIGSSCAYDAFSPNLYQDAFGSSIFSGKGLINVDAFYSLCCNFFKKDEVLSHDILEGGLLRTAFAGDIEFRDDFPSKTMSYFKRQHRWIRGDIQNIGFIGKKINTQKGKIENPLGAITKYQLTDNIRRALTPIVQFFIPVFAAFSPLFHSYNVNFIISICLISILIPYIISEVSLLIKNKFFSLSRKYYSTVLNDTKSVIFKALYNFILLPQNAVISADAVIRGLIRKYITHKNLLQWSTAAQTDNKIYNGFHIFAYYLPAEIFSISLLISVHPILRILGIIWSAFPFAVFFGNKKYRSVLHRLTTENETELRNDTALMWGFYRDYCTAEYNYLPPDNVQFSPVFRICERTSPTNIGMMLLSVLTARDLNIISSDEMTDRIDKAVSSVEKMKKFHGNLYNWYDIKTLELSPNPFVSSVDSGNFICSLTALVQGLREYRHESPNIRSLIMRIKKVIDETDLGIFYNRSVNLFSVGINPVDGSLSEHHYDMLMSEARMLSYYAIAKRIVPKKHWRALSRTMKRIGNYCGTVSYGGTMFEFFMPEILLKSRYGSLCYESLKYCVHAQKHEGRKRKLPFGVSESAYFAFDENLNYLYKPSGIQNAGTKRGLDSDYIVSPYSSYLAAQTDINSSARNLSVLESYGTKGIYGHYEAIDFTQNQKNGTVVKSYMAHHIGMSISAADNVINNGIMQRRFMRDPDMMSAQELLEEKIISGSDITKDSPEALKDFEKKESQTPMENLFFNKFYPQQPQAKILSNGEYTVCMTNLGAGISIYQGNDIFSRTTDLLNSPKGNYFALRDEEDTLYFSYLPGYCEDTDLSAEFLKNSVIFSNKNNEISASMEAGVYANIPSEYRNFTIKNLTGKQKYINLIGYLEPVLMKFRDFENHPAFARLFLEIEYDRQSKTIFIKRKDRTGDRNLYVAVGFRSDEDFMFNFSREDVLQRFTAEKTLFIDSERITKNSSYIPNPCVYFDDSVNLKPYEQKNISIFIITSFSKEDLIQNIAKIRSSDFNTNEKVNNPVIPSSIEERVAESMLPQLLFRVSDGRLQNEYILKNTLPISSLWEMSLSADLPLVTMEFTSKSDEETLMAYICCQNSLKICGINFDFTVIYNDNQNSSLLGMIYETIKHKGFEENIGIYGGIHIINISKYPDSYKTLLFASSAHIVPNNIVQIGIPSSEYKPLKIHPIDHDDKKSGFYKDSFIISEKTEVPWCHILSSQQFGTLLSESSLGFTYAINSYENPLTKWNNDTVSDNRGELLFLKYNNEYYDLILGASAEFSENYAVYSGHTDYFKVKTTVSVSAKGMSKKISVLLNWTAPKSETELIYYTEPVLSSSKENTSMIKTEFEENTLLINNPQNTAIKGFMAISSNEKVTPITNRESFFEGSSDDVNLQSGLCGAVSVRKILSEDEQADITFYLSFGNSKSSAVKMPEVYCEQYEKDNYIKIKTPSEQLNNIYPWTVNQALKGRMYARTGFYQRSGAYGFRDQLQDACSVLLIKPETCMVQIARACTAQFIEGDVLHWWHFLPENIMKGVRTLCSDDLLWLPYAVCEYIEKTADYNFLTVQISYCSGIELSGEEDEKYGQVKPTTFKENVYQHCKRAIQKAYTQGEHGLLKIGGGDWNDGFNKIGVDGKGESVWLTQFYVLVLRKFTVISQIAGDTEFIKEMANRINELYENLDNTFDEGQYARIYLSDEDTLGTQDSDFCKIDILPQAFSVLSQMPDNDKNIMAMDEAYKQLVDHDNNIIKLFTPAFDKLDNDIGYITAYPKGIRENGGQYTHAAIWLAIAFLQMGDSERGWELIKMINPAERYEDKELFKKYKNEPYYLSADIYTNPQCTGRGGWSIYTGAAGWYYRAVTEWLLGIKINKKGITIKPNIPKEWNGFSADIRISGTDIELNVIRGEKENTGLFDNGEKAFYIPIDGQKHNTIVIIQ